MMSKCEAAVACVRVGQRFKFLLFSGVRHGEMAVIRKDRKLTGQPEPENVRRYCVRAGPKSGPDAMILKSLPTTQTQNL